MDCKTEKGSLTNKKNQKRVKLGFGNLGHFTMTIKTRKPYISVLDQTTHHFPGTPLHYQIIFIKV